MENEPPEITRLKQQVAYWRARCQIYEAHHHRLEAAAADIKGRVEQFLVVLQGARPQGTDPTA